MHVHEQTQKIWLKWLTVRWENILAIIYIYMCVCTYVCMYVCIEHHFKKTDIEWLYHSFKPKIIFKNKNGQAPIIISTRWRISININQIYLSKEDLVLLVTRTLAPNSKSFNGLGGRPKYLVQYVQSGWWKQNLGSTAQNRSPRYTIITQVQT